MSEAAEIIKPLLSEDEMSTGGHIVIGTVKGELHIP
jgi:methanogenic corrinoid protein MtbC1